MITAAMIRADPTPITEPRTGANSIAWEDCKEESSPDSGCSGTDDAQEEFGAAALDATTSIKCILNMG